MSENNIKTCSKCNIEKDIVYFSKHRANKDGLQYQCKQCIKNTRELNKEKISLRMRKYYIVTRDKKLEYQRKYNENNKDKLAIYHAEYYDKNRDKLSLNSVLYYQKNRDTFINRARKYHKTAKGKAVNRNSLHRRRTIMKQGDVTNNQLFELDTRSKICYWCSKPLKKLVTHIDHYYPISKGGEHTLSNLVMSCSKCNLRKKAKDPIVFANSIGRLL